MAMKAADAGGVGLVVVGPDLVDVAAAARPAARGSVGVVGDVDAARTALRSETASAVLVEHDGPKSPAHRLLASLGADPNPAVLALVSADADPTSVLEAGATDYVSLAAARTDPALLTRRVDSVPDVDVGRGRNWYRSLLERTTDVVTVLDDEGAVRYASPSLREVMGYDPATFVGEDPFEYIHERDRGRVERSFGSVVDGGADETVEVQYRFRASDGEWVWVESVASGRPGDAVGGYVVATRAITARKESERQLEHYETLLDLMPDTVVITDTHGVHQEIHGFEGWSGYEPAELVGEHIAKTTPEADLEQGAEIVSALIRNEERDKATYETHIQTKDGEQIPFENHITLLPPDEDGKIPGSMSVLRNISDRKERERRLELAETVFQNVREGVFLLDATDAGDYEFRRVNRAFEELTGVSDEELRGRTVREFLDGELRKHVMSRISACETRQAAVEYELETEDEDGPTYWWSQLAPVIADGEVVSIVGTTRDITERKEREAELELKTRAMDEAPLGITIADATRPGRPIVYANEGFERLTGYDEIDIEGRNLAALTGPETDEDNFQRLERAMSRGEAATAELLFHRADETPVWTRVSVAPVSDRDGEPTHVVSFQQDITERKEYETEIERRFDEFGELLAEELGEPLSRARTQLSRALEDLEHPDLAAAEDSLELTESLLEDLTEVHSFTVPSRETSEAALLGTRQTD